MNTNLPTTNNSQFFNGLGIPMKNKKNTNQSASNQFLGFIESIGLNASEIANSKLNSHKNEIGFDDFLLEIKPQNINSKTLQGISISVNTENFLNYLPNDISTENIILNDNTVKFNFIENSFDENEMDKL